MFKIFLVILIIALIAVTIDGCSSNGEACSDDDDCCSGKCRLISVIMGAYISTVVGPRMEFLDVVPEYSGSAKDSEIFKNSRIYMKYSTRQLPGILVGDSKYPCLPFLMTPVTNPVTNNQIAYNNIQRRTQIIVEKAHGIWKRRFPCLSLGLSSELICSTTIVVACAVLHNLSLILNDKLPEEDTSDDLNGSYVHKISYNNSIIKQINY